MESEKEMKLYSVAGVDQKWQIKKRMIEC